MEDFVELCRSHTGNCGLLVNHSFLEHIHSHIQSSETCSFADTALEHPEFAVLNGELDVLHIVEVFLEVKTDVVKLLVNLRHCGLEGSEVCVVRSFGGLVERVRGADTCNHVLSLCVDEPLSVEFVVTVGRVT